VSTVPVQAAPVGVVVVGLHFGRTIAEEIGTTVGTAVRLAGVCDLDRDLAAATAARLGVRHYHDLVAVLADPAVEAVGLFTGPAGRAGLVRQAIRAGKHVMTTKPFELDPAAAQDVLTEARRRGLVVALNSPSLVLGSDLTRIRQWRDSLHLGRPVGAQGAVWASYQETPDGGWYDDPDRCPAAPVCRLGIYLINDMVRLFGPARQVQVLQRRLRTGRPTPDNAHLTLGFDGGVIGAVFASFCVDDGRPYQDRLTVNYERGTVTRVRTGDGTIALTLARAGHPVETHTVPDDGGYQWAEFARAIHSGQDGAPRQRDEILAGVRVLEAMGRAARSGQVEDVTVDGASR
jgi:predicted dehydrogenase